MEACLLAEERRLGSWVSAKTMRFGYKRVGRSSLALNQNSFFKHFEHYLNQKNIKTKDNLAFIMSEPTPTPSPSAYIIKETPSPASNINGGHTIINEAVHEIDPPIFGNDPVVVGACIDENCTLCAV